METDLDRSAELVAIDTAGRVLSRDDAVSVLQAGADRKGEAKFFDYGPVVLSIPSHTAVERPRPAQSAGGWTSSSTPP